MAYVQNLNLGNGGNFSVIITEKFPLLPRFKFLHIRHFRFVHQKRAPKLAMELGSGARAHFYGWSGAQSGPKIFLEPEPEPHLSGLRSLDCNQLTKAL